MCKLDFRDLVLLNIMREDKLLPLQFAVNDKLKRTNSEYGDNYVFVFDEVGCGKTVEAGICIWDTICNGGKNVLVVAPSNLSFNWYAELLSKFGLDFKIIGGTKDSMDVYYHNYNYNEIDCNKLSNLCIISYDSRRGDNSNAAIDRIGEKIKWDLIILDEGHENKNEQSLRYGALKKLKSKKVLFLSATPIKNQQEDFDKEFEVIKNILNKQELSFVPEPEKAVSFNLNYPISRNFKETLAGKKDFKKRNVFEITYKIDEQIVKLLPYDGLAFDKKRNCIMLFDNVLRNSAYFDVFVRYRKNKYDDEDVKCLCGFDSKIQALLNKLEEIVNEKNERVVIFCNHINVINYLKKILDNKFGNNCIEAIHGESYDQEERKRRIFMLDKENSEMDEKKIVILSHNIGSVGVNLSKFTNMINYELPYTPADLEQRFGRIDRLTNDAEELNLYFFKDDNKLFDYVYIQRIFMKLSWEVLPLLPGKNLLNTINDTIIENYYNLIDRLNDMKTNLENWRKKQSLCKQDYDNNKELITEINDLFQKSIVRINGSTIELEQIVINEIIVTIDEFLKPFVVPVNQTQEEVIKNYLEERNNRIFYKKVNGNNVWVTENCSLDFNGLTKLVFNNDYETYKSELDNKSKSILDFSKKIADQYKADSNNVFLNIQNQNYNYSQLFISLYGLFCALRKNNIKIGFDEIIAEYNGRI